MAKVCPNCIKAIEAGNFALWELAETRPEALPAFRPLTSWDELREFLVQVAGHLRHQELPE